MVNSNALSNFGIILDRFGQENSNEMIICVLSLLYDFSHFIEPPFKKGNDWSTSCFLENHLITPIVMLVEQICS